MDRAYAAVADFVVGRGYNPQWYVAKTKPRAERQVASVLDGRQINVYLPLLKRRALEPLFPGYLFLRIDCKTNEYLRSRSAPGVSYILNNEGAPIPLPEDLIDGIKHRLDKENSLGPAARFAPGDRVMVTSGPFRDVEAIFHRALTSQGRCLVLLQILGRLTRVQVGAHHLVKVRA
ncbi:MAG: hypothetical protein HY675_17830 [Chloroflexi bacterium]|nr:hypothetical protein [Chloroflexota bacterium]